ncbi:hypothetical protein HHL11_12645 [Ramlibacter sp. G-1-2-2]|uniref:Uncharacterized protein n=1 Tax=Ramlibacter agri TaxID=2728837 RepID=A0A848H0V6_9BURK|nr:Ig domain-containing protein [Ramlibacter agri]NML44606.1 hypothetical protein [Ramlibacter agri]
MMQGLRMARTGWEARGWKLASVMVLGAALAACGGGGGGGTGGTDTSGAGTGGSVTGGGTVSGGDGSTLNVNLAYNGSASLFRQVVIPPTLTGLNGYTPACSLTAGSLPPGMVLNADCSISGLPTQAGSFPITVHLGASGVSNTLDFKTSVTVLGPSVVYTFPSTVSAGATVDVRPLNVFWQPTPSDTVTYSLVGNPPPGLTIDSTGRVQGTPIAAGDYQFKVAVQVLNGGRTANQVQQFGNLVSVYVPTIMYDHTAAWVGLPFTGSPKLPAGGVNFQFSTTGTLPPGLALDSQTGVISGVATTPQVYPSNLDIVMTANGTGGTFTTHTQLQLFVESPVYINYSSGQAFRGQPFTMSPSVTNNSSDPLNGIAYNYVLASGILPAGLTLDAATGTISGTYPSTGYGSSSSVPLGIDVTTTINGISFVKSLTTYIGPY